MGITDGWDFQQALHSLSSTPISKSRQGNRPNLPLFYRICTSLLTFAARVAAFSDGSRFVWEGEA